MRTYKVNYSSIVNYDIDVEANSAEEARRKVADGDVDFGTAETCDETPPMVNNAEEVTT